MQSQRRNGFGIYLLLMLVIIFLWYFFTEMPAPSMSMNELVHQIQEDNVTAVAEAPASAPAPEEAPAAQESPAAETEAPEAEVREMTAAELVWKLSLLDRCMTREKLTEAFGQEPESKQDGSNTVYEFTFDGGVKLRLWGDPVLRAALQYGDRAFEIVL